MDAPARSATMAVVSRSKPISSITAAAASRSAVSRAVLRAWTGELRKEISASGAYSIVSVTETPLMFGGLARR